MDLKIFQRDGKFIVASVAPNKKSFRTDFTKGRKLIQATAVETLNATKYKNPESAKRAIRKRSQKQT